MLGLPYYKFGIIYPKTLFYPYMAPIRTANPAFGESQQESRKGIPRCGDAQSALGGSIKCLGGIELLGFIWALTKRSKD